MSISKYYNKTERLRQMSRKMERLSEQVNKEAMILLSEIQSNQVKTPSSFTPDQLCEDTKLSKEQWNRIIEKSKLR